MKLHPLNLLLPFIHLTNALPTTTGSPHTLYLLTCLSPPPPPPCPRLFLCPPIPPTSPSSTHLAVFFTTPPNLSSKTQTPTSIGELDTETGWTGTTRVRIAGYGLFTAVLAGGDSQEGEIVGEGTLGREPFVCFRDGVTGMRVLEEEGWGWGHPGWRGGDEGLECIVDVWCASLDVEG
ncbi:hypothetical protein M011DRAFT_481593 [Sporormia fimetaria CBS 119925]|uniref:Uncharacterized protein n=1 Tax=Sporormia fimetaria CBS 119925 TaxID=1340428 RepID=A0A6A6UYT1_9PLEO|nr:hypothetical protein M011DRAFT_481593 [Sporormia fimetaria CBS 119925]